MFRKLLISGLAAWVLQGDFVFGIEDIYERGGESVRWSEVGEDQPEIYRNWIEEFDFAEQHFSPAYHPSDPSPFWDRVDKQAPAPSFVIHSLWANPKHLIWDTPKNIGLNLKSDYYDTWRESDTGLEIAGDMLLGVPNTAMVAVNGVYDAGTNFWTDVWSPIVYGVPFLWGPRLLTGLTKDWAGVYEVVDVVPKVLWSVGLPVRKIGLTVADQVQKGTNFVYRTITHPMDVPDHVNRYWPPREYTPYDTRTYVPKNPQTTPDAGAAQAPPSRYYQSGEGISSEDESRYTISE
jgi:hypothetical protein